MAIALEVIVVIQFILTRGLIAIIVKCFHEDKPFNDSIIEQIAADQIDINDQRDLAALGYLTVGKRFDNDVNEILMTVLMVGKEYGLTLACARCHDHKFDPIPTADYPAWRVRQLA